MTPVPSDPVTSFITAGTLKDFAFTSVTDKGIYVCIHGNNNLFFDTTYGDTVTFVPDDLSGAIPLNPKGRWTASGPGVTSGLVFTLPPVAVGKVGRIFCVMEDVANYHITAFNVEHCTVDADVILFGGYFGPTFPATSFTRKGYAWSTDGLEVASLWGGLGNSPTLTGGTQLATGNGGRLNTITANDGEISFTASGSSYLSLFSFLIPSDSHPRVSGKFQPFSTDLTSLSGLAAGASVEVILPICMYAGTFRSWGMKLSFDPGLNRTVSAIIIRGGRSTSVATIGTTFQFLTGLSNSVIGGAGVIKNGVDSLSLGFSKYERFSIIYTNTGSAALPGGITVNSSFIIEPGVAGELMYGSGSQDFGSAVVDQLAYRSPLHPRDGTDWSNSNNDRGLIGIPLTINELVVPYQVEVTLGVDHQYYMDKNGVLQDGTAGSINTGCTLVNNSMGVAMARSKFMLPCIKGDLIAEVGVMRTGAISLRQSAAIKVLATTVGQFMWSGHSAVVTAQPDWVAQMNSSLNGITHTLANELRIANVVPPLAGSAATFNILGIVERLETGGTDPGTLTTKLRKNELGTSMPDLVFSGSEVLDEVGGSVSYNGMDTVSLLQDVDLVPDLTRQFWSIPGEITTTDPDPPLPPIEVVSEGSGIYKLVPGKRNDTIFIDVDAGTTRDVKIPNPFVKTGYIG